MDSAPPVRVSVGRSWYWPVFVGVAVGAAAGNIAAWALLKADNAAALPLAVVWALLVAAGIAWRVHRSQGVGDLLWDGAQWQWRGNAGQALAAIDLGGWMLLRFEPEHGARQWIATAREHTIGSWPALRAALYSRRPADPLDAPPA